MPSFLFVHSTHCDLSEAEEAAAEGEREKRNSIITNFCFSLRALYLFTIDAVPIECPAISF
jgi:hypothetical protein